MGNDEKTLKAETLRAMFKHYADVGLDHQRQSATTSNILLLIAGAILTLIGIDNSLDGLGDALGAAAMAIIGGFGMMWSWKQHETYKYWTNIAQVYQKELFTLVHGPRQVSELTDDADSETAKEYGAFAVYNLRIRYLWVALHGLVMVLGIVLAVGILWSLEQHLMAVAVGFALIAIMAWIVIVVVNFRGFQRQTKI